MAEQAILRRVRKLARSREKRKRDHELPGQPFDRELLAWSKLYRRTRELYCQWGGSFEAALVTTPRTLSSAILLEPRIEYSPIERELIWAATDPTESKSPTHFLTVRTYTSSLFHEQNHRLLWRLLPPPASHPDPVRRYLHLAEALVIAADIALADELGPARAEALYDCGSIYNPGSHARNHLGRREYRNYLHVIAYVSYLLLELNEPEEIKPWLAALFPQVSPKLRERAWVRGCRIDQQFIRVTNPFWQLKYASKVAPALRKGRTKETELRLPSNASDTREFYLQTEAWFDHLGI